MPKTLLLIGLGVALLGLVLVPLPGPGMPVLVLGGLLAIVGGAMHLGRRRNN